MPFQSEKQRRFLWAEHPEIAKRWADEYPNQKKLPMYANDKKPAESNEKDAALAVLRNVMAQVVNIENPLSNSILGRDTKFANSGMVKVDMPDSEKPTYAGQEESTPEQSQSENQPACESTGNNSSDPVEAVFGKLAAVLAKPLREMLETQQAMAEARDPRFVPQNMNLKRLSFPAATIAPPMGMAPPSPQTPAPQTQQPGNAQQGAPVGGGANPQHNPINAFGPLGAKGQLNGNAAFGVKNSPDSLKTAALNVIYKRAASGGAWTRAEGKSESGGLNAKGRASLKAQGHDIKAPVTESNPKGERAGRQNSFCARMCGMKQHETGAKTKSDPDSRINKSLRKWNCKCGSALDLAVLAGLEKEAFLGDMFRAATDPLRNKIRKAVQKAVLATGMIGAGAGFGGAALHDAVTTPPNAPRPAVTAPASVAQQARAGQSIKAAPQALPAKQTLRLGAKDIKPAVPSTSSVIHLPGTTQTIHASGPVLQAAPANIPDIKAAPASAKKMFDFKAPASTTSAMPGMAPPKPTAAGGSSLLSHLGPIAALTGVGSGLGAYQAPEGFKTEGATRGAVRGAATGAGGVAGNILARALSSHPLARLGGVAAGSALGYGGSGLALGAPSWQQKQAVLDILGNALAPAMSKLTVSRPPASLMQRATQMVTGKAPPVALGTKLKELAMNRVVKPGMVGLGMLGAGHDVANMAIQAPRFNHVTHTINGVAQPSRTLVNGVQVLRDSAPVAMTAGQQNVLSRVGYKKPMLDLIPGVTSKAQQFNPVQAAQQFASQAR